LPPHAFLERARRTSQFIRRDEEHHLVSMSVILKQDLRESSTMAFVKVTFEEVERELRRRNFGILATVSKEGRVYSTGVLYAVSPAKDPFQLYVITRSRNRKVRNIKENLNVSFVVPLPRRVLTFVPPACIQFQGTAEIVDAKDQAAVRAYRSSYFLRMILRVEDDIVRRQGGEACFIRIRPDPVVFTYLLGLPLWEFRKRAAYAGAKVKIPPERMQVRSA